MTELSLFATGPCRYCKRKIPFFIYVRGKSFRIEGVIYRYPGGHSDIMCYECRDKYEGPLGDDYYPFKSWPREESEIGENSHPSRVWGKG